MGTGFRFGIPQAEHLLASSASSPTTPPPPFFPGGHSSLHLHVTSRAFAKLQGPHHQDFHGQFYMFALDSLRLPSEPNCPDIHLH